MVDVSIVTKTSPEANWNEQACRQADGQDHILSQADALIKNGRRAAVVRASPKLTEYR